MESHRRCERLKPPRETRYALVRAGFLHGNPGPTRTPAKVAAAPQANSVVSRNYFLAWRYSGHDALPADCKVPWQLIVAVLRIRTSDPPPLAWHTPQSHSTAIRVVTVLSYRDVT